MKNADKIGNVAKQMIGVCNVIINLAEAEENDTYDDMLWDEVVHAQKLVLEFTKCVFEGEGAAVARPVEMPMAPPEQIENVIGSAAPEVETVAAEQTDPIAYDEAFFGGELNDTLGDKTNDAVVFADEDDEEKSFFD